MSGEGGAEDSAGLNSNYKVSMDTDSQGEESIGAADGMGAKEVDCTGAGVLGIASPPSEEKEEVVEEENKVKEVEEPAADMTNAPAAVINGDTSVDQEHSDGGFDPYDMLPKGKGAILCRFCRKDLGHGCRVRCAGCESFDLCLACFSAGIKLHFKLIASSLTGHGAFAIAGVKDGHEPYHPYRVSDSLEFPIFHKDWMASDELKLLNGVQRYGLGNWDDMSVQVFNRSKTAKQIREHYLDDYFGMFGSIFPPQIFKNEGGKYAEQSDSGELVVEPLPPTEDPSVPHFGKKVNSGFLATESMEDIDNWRRLEEQKTQSERPASPDDVSMTQSSLVNDGSSEAAAAQGPDQGEANPAFVADGGTRTTFKEKNSPTSANQRNVKSLPGYGLVGYMPLRGDFDTEYDQDAEQILADLEFSDSDEPSEKQLKLDVIAIYNKRLDERQRRKNFVVDRKLLDYKRIQMEERRRPVAERELVARMRVLSQFHSQEEHDALVENVLAAKRLRSRIEKLQGYQKLGLRNLSDVAAYEDKKERKKEMLRGGTAFEGGDGNGGWSNISSGMSGGSISKRHRPWSSEIEGWGGGSDASAADMNSAPGEDLLSEKEKELCGALGLLPQQYLVTKAAIVKESVAQGFVDRGSARRLVRLDVKQVDSAFDFFVSRGWISSGPPPDTIQSENTSETVMTPMETL